MQRVRLFNFIQASLIREKTSSSHWFAWLGLFLVLVPAISWALIPDQGPAADSLQENVSNRQKPSSLNQVYSIDLRSKSPAAVSAYVARMKREVPDAPPSVWMLELGGSDITMSEANHLKSDLENKGWPVWAFVHSRPTVAEQVLIRTAEEFFVGKEQVISSQRGLSGDWLTRQLASLDANVSGREWKYLREQSQGEFSDVESALSHMGLRPSQVEVAQFVPVENWLRFLSQPLVLCFLLALGFSGLLIESRVFGLGVGAVMALASFGLFFWRSFESGHGHWLGWGLVVLGLIGSLMFCWVRQHRYWFFVPGQIAFLAGLYLLLSGNWFWALGADHFKALYILLGSLFFFAIAATVLISYVPANHMGGRLFWATLAETRRDRQNLRSQQGSGPHVGDEGVAITDLIPGGKVRFIGEVEEAQAEKTPIRAGTRVVIISKSDEGYFVRPSDPLI